MHTISKILTVIMWDTWCTGDDLGKKLLVTISFSLRNLSRSPKHEGSISQCYKFRLSKRKIQMGVQYIYLVQR